MVNDMEIAVSKVITRISVAVVLALTLWPVPVSSAEPLQVKVVSLTSSVRRGDDASLAVQTVPHASCVIAVRYKTGISKATGLVPKTSDGAGKVGWTWRVSTGATPGKWPITVTCSAGGNRGTVEAAFVVR